MNVLLDTCTILWLVNEDDKLSDGARKAIDDATLVHISPVSAWELGLKIVKGKLTLPEALPTWWIRVAQTHDLIEFPLHAAAAARSTALPAIHHDPADRLLIAVAIEHGFTLLTPDPKIRQYPDVQTLW
jgi:PIN domain nuclease of toxin-antitoxin system